MSIKLFCLLALNCCFIPNLVKAQKLQEIGKLPSSLAEISGLIPYNDSLFICHNDSGDLPQLYIINRQGTVLNQVLIENAINVDWEDLTIDDRGNIYIADTGNNLNMRRNLSIYKINADSLLYKKSVLAKQIHFSYEDQFAFPPEATDLNFDSEALGFYQDTLYLFTKCRSEPYSGFTTCYYLLPDGDSIQMARKKFEVQLHKRKMRKDAVTSVSFYENHCYLLTYSGIIELDWQNRIALLANEISFGLWTQKEAFCRWRGFFYLADERFKFTGGNLYLMEQ